MVHHYYSRWSSAYRFVYLINDSSHSKGFIFYIIVNELFSSKSPTRIYEEALKICTSDIRVRDLLGEPITGCGESTRRGRRTHIS